MIRPEREIEIRQYLDNFGMTKPLTNVTSVARDLIAEIDRLRATLKVRNDTQVTGYCLRCEQMASQFEDLERLQAQSQELAELKLHHYKVVAERDKAYAALQWIDKGMTFTQGSNMAVRILSVEAIKARIKEVLGPEPEHEWTRVRRGEE